MFERIRAPFSCGYFNSHENWYTYRSEEYHLYNLGRIFREYNLPTPKTITKGYKPGIFRVNGVTWSSLVHPKKAKVEKYRKLAIKLLKQPK